VVWKELAAEKSFGGTFMSLVCLHPVCLGPASVTFAAETADMMEVMRKPWVYKRKNIKGWWTGWYEGGKRKGKALPNKSLAEHFRHIKYTQLNSDVFTSVVDFDWHQMVEEYRKVKQVEGLQQASIYEAMLSLGHIKRLAKGLWDLGSTRVQRLEMTHRIPYSLDVQHSYHRRRINMRSATRFGP
jgi:hypothetical protein